MKKPIKKDQKTGKITDRIYWQSQLPKIRFLAAWDLIVNAYRQKGIDVDKLRIEKYVENYQRQPWIE